ncbi:perlucin-like protein [Crassostrea virginica]
MEMCRSTALVLLLICVLGGPKAASQHQCDDGWISFQRKCYKFSIKPENFQKAMRICYSFGSRLLEVKSKSEEQWIDLHILLLGYSYGVWLGFSDIQKEGQFVALSDRKRPHYINWWKGEPNNVSGNEHCVMYVKRTGWNDEKCSLKLNYVCTK